MCGRPHTNILQTSKLDAKQVSLQSVWKKKNFDRMQVVCSANCDIDPSTTHRYGNSYIPTSTFIYQHKTSFNPKIQVEYKCTQQSYLLRLWTHSFIYQTIRQWGSSSSPPVYTITHQQTCVCVYVLACVCERKNIWFVYITC